MQSYASVFRTGDIMKEGCDKMADIYAEMEDLKVSLTLQAYRILYIMVLFPSSFLSK